MDTEKSGMFFEDFRPEMKFTGRLGRTVTDADNIWFTLLTNNNNQIHFNVDYAGKNFPGEPFRGRMVVNGFFTLATVAGILVEQTSANGFMLGLENIKFLKPVFAGDTIYAKGEVTEVRASSTRPDNGIVKIKTFGYNQRGENVVEFDRTLMVRKRKTVWISKRRAKLL
jgi:itaconyl-CoA hydratase